MGWNKYIYILLNYIKLSRYNNLKTLLMITTYFTRKWNFVNKLKSFKFPWIYFWMYSSFYISYLSKFSNTFYILHIWHVYRQKYWLFLFDSFYLLVKKTVIGKNMSYIYLIIMIIVYYIFISQSSLDNILKILGIFKW